MKKYVGALMVFSLAFSLAGCSKNNSEQSIESSETKQETKASKEKEKRLAKEAEKQNKEEQAEKEKQELIAKKVLEADTAMKAAEANPNDETIAAAKAACEAIPGGNKDLTQRLEAATANLESLKQQAAAQAQQAQQQPSQGEVDSVGRPAVLKQNDADGNGIADDSPYNQYSSWEEAQRVIDQENARKAAELQQQQDAAFAEQAKNQDQLPQVQWGKENGTLNPDGTPTGQTE